MGLFSLLFPRKKEPAKTPGAKTVYHKVSGTSRKQKELMAMGKKNPDYALTKRELVKKWPEGVTVYEYKFSPKKAELVPDPDNEHNPKAIKVFVDGVHVGYIKDGSCAHIHKLMRENRLQSVKPSIVGGKSKTLDWHDEYSVREGQVSAYELEKNETTIGVRLAITELPPVNR